jgi:transposase-like protein
MSEHTGSHPKPSTVVWESLEASLRTQIQGWLQDLLDEEVTAFLGRIKSQRRDPQAADGTAPAAYRNGYGKPRTVTTPAGTVTVRRPRVRGLDERFESRVLPLFARRTPAVEEMLPTLYLHGLAAGDFEAAMRGLLGEEAALSPSSMVRLKAKWQQEYDAWRQRRLEDQQVVYLWVDGIYVKAGLEKEKAALLVAVAALADGSKVILAVQAGHRESTESWSSLLRELKRRGMNCPRLVIGDGHLGIWGALANVYPEAGEQRCWNHRILNVLDRVPQGKQAQVKVWLREIMYAPTREKAVEKKERFQEWCQEQRLEAAGTLLSEDWERLVAYYDYPEAHWVHLRTTNPVESPFAAVRLRTTAAKRYKRVENATAMIWKLLMVAEKSFRKVNAPELMASVAAGATYVDGIRSWPQAQEDKAAA